VGASQAWLSRTNRVNAPPILAADATPSRQPAQIQPLLENAENPSLPNPVSYSYYPASKDIMATETKEFQSFQIHDKDTGSADVQIALLTQRINQLTDHLKSHVKDHSSRRGLLMMVAKRRSLLDYLKDTASDRYKTVLEKLNLRK
jgi:small subunit ribosomal protein S15